MNNHKDNSHNLKEVILLTIKMKIKVKNKNSSEGSSNFIIYIKINYNIYKWLDLKQNIEINSLQEFLFVWQYLHLHSHLDLHY